jgi:RNA polymerase sigma-70 factor, ECF subfamily
MPELRRYACSLTHDPVAAEDLVQETLARGIAKAHLWRQGTSLRAWLFTMLHNRHVDGVRRAARRGIRVDLGGDDPCLQYPPRQGDGLRLRDLRRALAQLPDEQRSVVLLVGVAREPYAAVAARLDIPIGTVRSRAARGRRTLRRLIDDIPAASPAAAGDAAADRPGIAGHSVSGDQPAPATATGSRNGGIPEWMRPRIR